jgi:hypothetical protein
MDSVNLFVSLLQEAVSGFNNSEDDYRQIHNVLHELSKFSNEKLCFFFQNPNVVTLLKSYFHHESSTDVQSYGIRYLGLILIRFFLIINGYFPDIDFDSYSQQFESQNDFIRRKEDFIDYINEEMKFIISSSLSFDLKLKNASFSFLFSFFTYYTSSTSCLQEYFDSLLGDSEINLNHAILNKKFPLSSFHSKLRSALNPLMNLCLDLLSTPNLITNDHFFISLYNNTMKDLSYERNSLSINLLNSFFSLYLCCYAENYILPSSGSASILSSFSPLLELVDLEKYARNRRNNLLLGGTTVTSPGDTNKQEKDLTIATRNYTFPLVINGMIEEWIENGLLHILDQSINPMEKLQVIKEIILLTQYSPFFDHLRAKVSILLIFLSLFLPVHFLFCVSVVSLSLSLSLSLFLSFFLSCFLSFFLLRLH